MDDEPKDYDMRTSKDRIDELTRQVDALNRANELLAKQYRVLSEQLAQAQLIHKSPAYHPQGKVPA